MGFGTAVGTLVHRALEATDFDRPDLEAALAAALQPGSHELGGEGEQAAAGLALALRTPLADPLDGLALADLGRADRLDELAFELPLAGGERPCAHVTLHDLAGCLARGLPAGDPLAGYPARLADPALASRLSGYLTGSIDLVLRRTLAGQPSFWVIDYKTNWLGAPGEPLPASSYRARALAEEMQRSHYALQALLYLVALHRYLRWRLPGYDPARHLGGAQYLFLRGMVGRPSAGVFAWRPPAELIAALSDLLSGVRS
jgi:exodeoxyribonuclease V beta subunit